MAQKINPILFRKNSKGLYHLKNKLKVLQSLYLGYSFKNSYHLNFLLENYCSFFKLQLNYLGVLETNNSLQFIFLRYFSPVLKKTSKKGSFFKQTILKSLLLLIPVKSLYLKLLNNRKVFISKLKKNKLFQTLRRMRLFVFDPFNLIKILRYSFFTSSIFAFFLAKELKTIKKRHNRFLLLCSKILKLSIKNSNLKGIKISIKGKFNGRLRAKVKTLQIGTLLLQETTSVVDYCSLKSVTTVGVFGVKVWLNFSRHSF
jgi:hypothetical protein